MKIIPNLINNNLAKYYTFILIFQLIIQLIDADKCENCIVNSDNKTCIRGNNENNENLECENCNSPRPHIDGNCYSCGENFAYYSILDDGTCINKTEEGCSNKIINETNECVGHCPSDSCELYDYCYKNIDNEILEITSSSPYIMCKCKYKKQNVTINNKNYYICSNQDYICPSGYYNSDTKECVSGCGTNRVLIKWNLNGEISERWCLSKCLSDQYIYEKNNSCLESCPNDKYYIYTRYDGSKECLDECNNDDFYSSDYICVSECSGENVFIAYDYKNINDDKYELVKQCVNGENKGDYYKYNEIYIKFCNYTQILFNITTYTYEFGSDEDTAECKGTCNEYCSTLNTDGITYYIKDGLCVVDCGNYPFFYNNECLQSCDTGDEQKHDYKMNYSIINNNEEIISLNEYEVDDDNKYPDKKQCLKECPIGTFIDEENKTCYISSCYDGKYINSTNLECQNNCYHKIYSEVAKIKILQIPTENPETGDGGGRILEGEEEAQTTEMITRKYCIASCPVSAPYYNHNGNECYNTSCGERGNYSAYDKPYECYDLCSLISNGEYNYEKDYICYKETNAITCDNYFYNVSNLIQCATLQECIDKEYSYIKGKECVNECEPKYYRVEKIVNNEGRIQNIGKCFSEAKECANVNYIFIKNHTCLSRCDDYKTSETNPIANEDGDTCFDSCPQNYPYKDTVKKLCLMHCENFFYKDECYDSCKDKGKYHFEGSYECLDNCTIEGTPYYIIEGDENKLCYHNCPDNYYIQQNTEQNNQPYICVPDCGTDNYYEDEKKCISNCDIYETKDGKVCVHQCPQGQKINGGPENNFFCDSSCLNESRPYILNTTLTATNPLIVEKCVENCPSGYKISNSTKYCLKECTFSESYEYNGYCYEKCPSDTFPNDVEKKCYNKSSEVCTGDFKYYEKDEYDNYRCKKTCYPEKYSYPEGGECMAQCPAEYNYISYNNLCLKNCSGYGLYYKNNSGNNYTCLSSCSGEGNLTSDSNECIEDDKCPDDLYKTNNKCTKDCSLDANKPFATIDEKENKICAIKCNETQPNYGSDKICKLGCNDSENIIDWDDKCVSNCSHSYYKYIQEGKCVNQCNDTNFYLGNKCVGKCESPYNYIEGNICQTKCSDNNPYVKPIENNLFQCVESCGDLYYYESGSIYNQKKCFEKCKDDDFIIQDTHICISVCPSTHKSYFADKSDENRAYANNTCVLKCPSDKPYLYSEKCVDKCPTLYKYHIEGEYNCINDCPGSTYTDNEDKYTCKSYCPNDKFLDNNKKDCIVKCPPSFPFYIKGVNECIKECDSGYHIENETICVEYCSDGYYLFDNNTCLNSCSSDKYFVNIYDDNKCVEKCPENYSFYAKDEVKDINYCKIKCDNVSAPNGTCLQNCEESDHKHYNYKNMTCLDNCPLYSVKISDDDDVYKCYEKCPSDKPFSKKNTGDDENENECVESCNTSLYTNFTSNECQENCDKFFYEESENRKYCLDTCDDLGLFLKGEKVCVKNCGDGLSHNMATKKCECEKYYSIEDDGSIKCLREIDEDYKYIKYGTYQCLKNCSSYSYYDENYCYSSEDQLPSNIIIKENGKIECKNKYYSDNSTKTKICLGENDPCPLTHKYLIPETRECVDKCITGYTEKGDYCLNQSNCNYSYFYIDSEEKNYQCVDNCQNSGYYLIEEMKQCVKDCSETDYYILYNNQCYSTCNNFLNTVVTKATRTINGETKTIYECSCTSDLWYKDENDNNNIKCNSEGKSTCEELTGSTKNLLVKDTKECVGECPDNYKYKFNEECYNDCKDIKKYYGYEMKNENNDCKCNNLWKSENNKKICIEGNICNEEEKKLLVGDTLECIDICPDGYEITFNNTCYKNCPDNTEEYTKDNAKSCICKNKWYKYDDKSLNINNIIKCLEECPKDFYPYLDDETRECLDDISKCIDSNKKIFNNICYKECPSSLKTKAKDGSSYCECDKDKGLWQKYSSKDKIIYECGLNKCPGEKNYIDADTNECLYACGNKYHLLQDNQDYCYSSCPGNTALVDEISKECVEVINFDNPSDLKTLDEKVIDNIKEIYPKTSKGGLVYNVNNSTLQIYGVNKNKTEKQDLIMRNNLTYIDLSKCIDKIYEKNSLSEDTDIIIVKYDIASSNSLIKPVEYKIINSKTGAEIPLDACEENSIVISYPLSDILKNFATENNLRNLEDNNNLNLNLREKFLKGKELNLEDGKIDSFNYNNKLYTDICYPLKLNGKDVILEDRFNYLYPLYSFCESNCLYDRTDFSTERVYCNCSPKDGVNFQRTFELLDTKANIDDVKKKQKGSILKCLGKISEIGKNFGFFYGFIILLAEIAMLLLTIFYSYKVYMMRIKKKFDIDVNKTNNIDTENIESMNLSGEKKTGNKNEEIIKTSERNLVSENPPKRNTSKLMTNIGEDKKMDKSNKKNNALKGNEIEDPEVINIKKTKNRNIQKNNYDLKEEKISSANSYNLYYGKSSEDVSIKEMDDDDNIFDLIKVEQKLLTIDYDLSLKKNRAEILIMIITEILDKIYLIKAIWFLNKYELFSIYFSLYLLWHMLILSFLSLFYNNSTLHKIWIKDNYPNLNFHLSFGFLSCIISFIIYKGLYILVNNEKKIKEIESIAKENKEKINEKYKKMMFWGQIKLIIFYAVEFIFVFLFFLYITAFCGVYYNAKAKLVESYGIALIEVVIIKILYGLVLGILRKVSLVYRINILYRIVQFLDLYIA